MFPPGPPPGAGSTEEIRRLFSFNVFLTDALFSLSAKYSGVRVNKITVLAFIYNGCLAAIAGTLYAGRAHSARWDFGSGVEMNVIAAVVLGGTAMSGGTGSAIGALIGSFLIMMIDNGLVIGGLGVAQQTFMRGIIIILAVALSEIGRMKKKA